MRRGFGCHCWPVPISCSNRWPTPTACPLARSRRRRACAPQDPVHSFFEEDGVTPLDESERVYQITVYEYDADGNQTAASVPFTVTGDALRYEWTCPSRSSGRRKTRSTPSATSSQLDRCPRQHDLRDLQRLWPGHCDRRSAGQRHRERLRSRRQPHLNDRCYGNHDLVFSTTAAGLPYQIKDSQGNVVGTFSYDTQGRFDAIPVRDGPSSALCL